MFEEAGRIIFWSAVKWGVDLAAKNLPAYAATAAGKIREYSELPQKYAQLQQEHKTLRRSTDYILHEVRTTAMNISHTVEALKESAQSPGVEKDERIEAISSTSTKLLKITNTSLDLSKLKEGKMPLEIFNINDLINGLRKEMKESLKKKGLELDIRLPSEEGICIESKEVYLRGLLDNLISNAIKFTPPEKGAIELHVTYPQNAQIGEEIELKITVKDKGKGMSTQDQTKLFRFFSQVEHSTEGSGIGLFNSKRIAQALGGDMRLVESKEGEGSTFECTIRCKKSLPKKEEKAPSPSIQRRAASQKRILIVDDNKTIRQMTLQQLIRAGYGCETTENGQEAVDKCKSQKFDVILMDINMPVMGGIEAAKKIRSQEDILKLNRDVCIIGLSASDSGSLEADDLKAVHEYMDNYLMQKGVSDKLLELIDPRESAVITSSEDPHQKKTMAIGASATPFWLPTNPALPPKCGESVSNPALPTIALEGGY
jgi:signal transduction histidine kinase/ActR/RegA family two-component response regulator